MHTVKGSGECGRVTGMLRLFLLSEADIDFSISCADNCGRWFISLASFLASMFTHFIHLLMCLTVLVCPAMGGACCADVGDASAEIGGCEHHCCCDAEGEQAPVAPDCPEPCHDCFCAGALPPGFGASVELSAMVDLTAIVSANDLAVTSGPSRREFASRDESPPHGRTLLTSYCRFLL